MFAGTFVLVALLVSLVPAQPGAQGDSHFQFEFSHALGDYHSGRYDRVILTLEKLITGYPQEASCVHLMGLALLKLGRSQEAFHFLSVSLKLAPGHPVYSANIARAYLGRGEPEKAEEVLSRSLEVAPTPLAYQMLGFMRLDKQRGKEAFSLFEKAMHLDPSDVRSWYYMGLTHHAYGHFDEAIGCYRKALGLAPTDLHANLQLAKLYAVRGNWQSALTHLQEVEKSQKDSSEVYRLLSQSYIGLRDFSKGLAMAERAVALSPEEPVAHFQLGQALVRLGRRDEARVHLRYLDEEDTLTEPSLSEHWRKLFGSVIRN
jgi:Flp pilus assembly protein TadD